MKEPCQHVARTQPRVFYIRKRNAPLIIGEAHIAVCLECGHVAGIVHSASLFNPKGPFRFESPDGTFEEAARKALETEVSL